MKTKITSKNHGKIYDYSESFGVYDNNGREVGSHVSIYEFEVASLVEEEQKDGMCGGHTVLSSDEAVEVGDSYYYAYNIQTRNGEDFGGSRARILGLNLDELKKEIHAKMNDTKKRAVKKYEK
jgi:hypothetical protein